MRGLERRELSSPTHAEVRELLAWLGTWKPAEMARLWSLGLENSEGYGMLLQAQAPHPGELDITTVPARSWRVA